MSNELSLRERLGPRAPIRDDFPRASLSDRTRPVTLRRTGLLHRPIDIARALAPVGVGLRAAHKALTDLDRQNEALVTINEDADLDRLAQVLEPLNVALAVRTRPPVPDITAIRQRHGWTQRELADLARIELRTLQNWEQGRNVPDAAAIALLTLIDRDPVTVDRLLADNSV